MTLSFNRPPLLLKTAWVWQFMVKDQLSYGLNDFIQSYTPITQVTQNYRELIVAINEMPPFDQIYNANITLFKKGIENKWEDSNNDSARNIEFTFDRGNLSGERLNWIILIFINITLLNNDQIVNGIYIKIKEKSYLIQFWVKSEIKSQIEKFEKNIQIFAKKIKFNDGFYCGLPLKIEEVEIKEEDETQQFKGLKISELNQYRKSTFKSQGSRNSSFSQKNSRNFDSVTPKQANRGFKK
ncbi:Eukaryotic initiation factor 4E [Spironucleus salmonicida]|uniref:Eukaryotic initiation factor 4E n=1 Tax=Spironucleus salmonicida TaxID=348837 RepID=V6LT79_9EUKA|nr:Eukaryotic initiation factor 4E [Spironucleus salmonicida]|eukprot:EST47463.1 Eukaryotic initiation factor 4E [Spironucleus salmonicida]